VLKEEGGSLDQGCWQGLYGAKVIPIL